MEELLIVPVRTPDEIINVINAYKEGKAIQEGEVIYQNDGSTRGVKEYKDISKPHWDWIHYDYRVKPEVKEHKCLLHLYEAPNKINYFPSFPANSWEFDLDDKSSIKEMLSTISNVLLDDNSGISKILIENDKYEGRKTITSAQAIDDKWECTKLEVENIKLNS